MFKSSALLAAILSLAIAVPLSAQSHAKATAHKAKKAAAAESAAPVANPTSFAQLSDADQAKAKQVYGIDCALCHGADGNGQSEIAESMKLNLDNWTNSKSIAAKTNQDLFNKIRKGSDKMPPEPKDRASDAVVQNLVLYIRSLAKEHPDVVPAAAPSAAPGSPQGAAPSSH